MRQDYLAEGLERFAADARAIFDKRPELNSLIYSVAQYWNDGADDEIHGHYIASGRSQPLWPHECNYDEVDQRPQPLDLCEWCSNGNDVPFAPTSWDFERFMKEGSHQEEAHAEAYNPIAIARRVGSVVEIETVAVVKRFAESGIPGHHITPAWLDDDRAKQLYELACAIPRDDEPRRVLADYLLERGVEHGELLALELARPGLDVELCRRVRTSWLAPISGVLIDAGSDWERGFLVAATVSVDEDDDVSWPVVAGAPAWGTVEQLVLRGKAKLDPAMLALREVRVENPQAIVDMVRSSRPWTIESLDIEDPQLAVMEALARTRTLPKLRKLRLHGCGMKSIRLCQRAPWWPQLAELVLVGNSLADGRELAAELPTCQVAVELDGWRLAILPDKLVVSCEEFSPHATFTALAKILAHADTRYELVPGRAYVPVDHDYRLIEAIDPSA